MTTPTALQNAPTAQNAKLTRGQRLEQWVYNAAVAFIAGAGFSLMIGITIQQMLT